MKKQPIQLYGLSLVEIWERYGHYTIHCMLVSPIGLSMITNLTPTKMLGMMMGAWYFATSVADALAGDVSKWTVIKSASNNPALTNNSYAHVFGIIGSIAIITGLLILLMASRLRRLTN